MDIKYDLYAETSLLGAMMLDEEKFNTACQELEPTYFYFAENQIIFDALINIYKSGTYPSYESLRSFLKTNNQLDRIGNNLSMMRMNASVNDSPFYIQNLKELHFKTQFATLLRNATQDFSKKSMDEIYKLVDSTRSATSKLHLIDFKESLDSMENGKGYDAWQEKRQQEFLSGKKISGFSTGFPRLDVMINGLNAGTYNILAGEPGSGKTAFGLQVLSHLIHHNVKCCLLSLEMTLTDINVRMLSINSGVSVKEIKTGSIVNNNIHFHDVNHARKILEQNKHNFLMSDSHINNLNMLRCMMQKAKDLDCKVIMIDYLQQISHKAFSPTEQIKEISETIRVLLKETGLAGIILSQLNKGTQKEVLNADRLYGSGQLHKDAHTILMIDVDPETRTRKLIITKNRDGETGSLKYSFDGKIFSEHQELQGYYPND